MGRLGYSRHCCTDPMAVLAIVVIDMVVVVAIAARLQGQVIAKIDNNQKSFQSL